MVMAPIDVRKPFPPKCPSFPPAFPAGPIGPGGPHPINPAVMDAFAFARKDKNRDASLSLDEWVRTKQGEVTQADIKQFERYDRNDDGAVSKDEYLAGRQLDRKLKDWFKQGFEGIKEGIRPVFFAQPAEGK